MIKSRWRALKLKKYIRYGLVASLAGGAVFFAWQSWHHAGTRDFFRSAPAVDRASQGQFRVDAAADRIYFLPGGEPRELKGIPSANACFFRLQGEKTFTIRSPFPGRSGFYSHVFLEAAGNGKIHFKIGVKRQGRFLALRQIRARAFNAPVFQSLTLAEGEPLEISCQGEGIVYFSKPILYRIREAPERDYVFLIAVDTLRGDAVGSRVNGKPLTPNIERFKRDSVDFAHCYSQSPWTLPAFMSMFTGQYEFIHRMYKRSALGLDKPFLVKELAARYVTINLNPGSFMSKQFGFARHFDYFETSPSLANASGGRELFAKALDLVDRGRFPASFMFLHTYQVHSPYAPPAEFLERLNASPQNTSLRSVPFSSQRKKFMPVAGDLLESYKELYHGEVLAFDSYFGEFVAALKRRGIYDRSLIVLMSDHGEEFFEHRGWEHNHSMYDELLHVPLVIKFPGGMHSGRTIQENVGIIDILPTILAAAGIRERHAPIDGLDLAPLLKGEKLPRPFLFSSVSNCRYLDTIPAKFAIFSDRFKVICNDDFSASDLEFFAAYGMPPQPGQVEIYDLERDPGEQANVFAARQDVYRRVSKSLKWIRALIHANLGPEQGAKQGEIDEELQKQLKSLGYL